MKCLGGGKKARNFHCKIILLDEQELIQEIKESSLGQELLDNVFKHLNLIETSYFGVRFIDTTGQTYWLDANKKILKQLNETEVFTFYFGVKFYAADPCKLLEEITRYQFFLQIRQDVLQGRLNIPNDIAAELCACIVQSELGDFDPKRHTNGYVRDFNFMENQTADLEECIVEFHKSMRGQVPAESELKYLEKVKWLEMYGVDLHPVMGEDNVDYFLGLTPSGLIVLRNKTRVGNYLWPRIVKLSHKGKYFMIKVKTKNNEDQTYGFESPTKAACKHLWRCSSEHHAFFKLVQVVPTTYSTTKNFSLNSRFRDSGRSDISLRRRAQPQFVRIPSKRFQKRIVEGAQDDDGVAGTSDKNPRNVTYAQPQTRVNIDSPKSSRSAPWGAPSPKSARSDRGSSSKGRSRSSENSHKHHRRRRRSGSGESASSQDDNSYTSSRRRHRRSRRGSDGESEVSRSSNRSHHGKRRHHRGSSSRRTRDSGSDSENHTTKHGHRHKAKYELVDSESQWNEVQKRQVELALQHAAVVQKLLHNSNNRLNIPSPAKAPHKKYDSLSRVERKLSREERGKEIEYFDPSTDSNHNHDKIGISGRNNQQQDRAYKAHRGMILKDEGNKEIISSDENTEGLKLGVDKNNSPPPPYSLTVQNRSQLPKDLPESAAVKFKTERDVHFSMGLSPARPQFSSENSKLKKDTRREGRVKETEKLREGEYGRENFSRLSYNLLQSQINRGSSLKTPTPPPNASLEMNKNQREILMNEWGRNTSDARTFF